MSPQVFSLVLAAALLHALWNALLRRSGDTSEAMLGLVLGHAPFAVLALAVAGPPRLDSWPWLVAGAGLHTGYQLFLMRSYRQGELTQVYPIARGSAPLATAVLSTTLLRERLGAAGWAGVGLTALGLMSLVLAGRQSAVRGARPAGLALLAGLFTAGYSLVDGLGARAADTAMGFYGVLSLINSAGLAAIMERARPGVVRAALARAPGRALVSGGASFTAFAIVVWAFTRSPIALVAALRETSVIFALVLGVVFLKERLTVAKLVATLLVGSGVLLLRTAA